MTPRPRSLVLLVLLCGIALGVSAQSWTPTQPVLSRTEFTSTDTNPMAVLTIYQRGRYALWAESDLGATIRVVDAMAGTLIQGGASRGTNASNARVDINLEPGDYQVLVETGSSTGARLKVRPFTLINGSGGYVGLPALPEGGAWEGELGDFQMAGWWVMVDNGAKPTILDAVGRGVGGITILEDGLWDAGVRVMGRTIQLPISRTPSTAAMGATPPKQDMGFYEVHQDLAPGRYLVLVYGGVPRFAMDGQTTIPARVRRGYLQYSDQGKANISLGALGFETIVLGDEARVIDIEAQGALPVTASITSVAKNQIRLEGRSVTTGSLANQRRVQLQGAGSNAWLVLQGVPGQRVNITWTSGNLTDQGNGLGSKSDFADGASYYVHGRSSLGALDRGSFSLAAINVVWSNGKQNYSVQDLRTPVFISSSVWYQRVNNTSALNSFIIQVKEAGRFSVVEKNTEVTATYRFQPLEDVLNGSDTRPIEISGGRTANLLEKVYVLTVIPNKRGVLDFVIMGGGPNESKANQAMEQGSYARPGVSLMINDPRGTMGTLALSGVIGQAGLQIYPLPYALEQGLSLDLEPGEVLTLPVTLGTKSLLVASEGTFRAQLNGRTWESREPIEPGRHTLVFSGGDAGLHLTMGLRKFFDLPGFVSPIPDAILAEYPQLTLGTSAWKDYQRTQTQSYVLRVPESGPWVLSSEGRLQLKFSVDQAFRRDLFTAEGNGPGGNATLEAYLGRGTYRLRTQTLGLSMGRAGLSLSRPPLVQAPALVPGTVSRVTAPPGGFTSTILSIDSPGAYYLEPLSQTRSLPFRIEDMGNWPLGETIRQGKLLLNLPRGQFRVIQYPGQNQQIRLLSLEKVPSPLTLPRDSTPIPITLNKEVVASWRETSPRVPQVFSWNSPGDVLGVLNHRTTMGVTVRGPSGEVAYTSGTSGSIPMTLSKGQWTFSFLSKEVDDNKDYSFTLSSQDLLEGQGISLQGNSVPFVVGTGGFVELWSLAMEPLAATIRDSKGSIIARSSPLQDDWNFGITARLEPGRYTLETLRIGRTGSPQGPSYQSLTTPGEGEYDDNRGYGEDYSEDDYYDEEYSEEYYGGDERGQSPANATTREGPRSTGILARYMSETMESLFDLGRGPRIFLNTRQETRLSPISIPGRHQMGPSNTISVFPFTNPREAVLRITTGGTGSIIMELRRGTTVVQRQNGGILVPLEAGVAYELWAWSQGEQSANQSLDFEVLSRRDLTLTADWQSSVFTEQSASFTSSTGRSVLLDQAENLLYSPGLDRPLAPFEGSVVITGTRGWFVRSNARGGIAPLGTISGGLVDLVPGQARAMALANGRQGLSLVVPSQEIALVEARANSVNPGLYLRPLGSPEPRELGQAGLLGRASRTQAVLEGSWLAQMWDPQTGGRGPGLPNSDLGTLRYTTYPLSNLTLETILGKPMGVDAGKAFLVTIPRGVVALNVAMEAGTTLAVFDKAGSSSAQASFLMGQDKALSTTIPVSEGQRVVVVNASTQKTWTVLDGSTALPESITEFEMVLDAPRNFEVPSAEAEGQSLYILGSSTAPQLYTLVDGLIMEAKALSKAIPGIPGTIWQVPSKRGTLVFSGDRGLVKVWVAPSPTDTQDTLSLLGAYLGKNLRTRDVRADQGQVSLASEAQRFTITMASPGIISATSLRPGILALEDSRGGLVTLDTAFGKRGAIIAMVPAGTYKLVARPLGGQPMGGELQWTVLVPQDLGEGAYGPMAIARPGERILHRFVIPRTAKVGLAVRASSEVLTTRLLNEQLLSLGEGPVLFKTLEPGTYYWIIEAGESTVRYQTAAWGLQGTLGSIPDEVRKAYESEE